jgi:hypothetical protein
MVTNRGVGDVLTQDIVSQDFYDNDYILRF